MNDELRELYQEVIVDHGRKPRNFCELPTATHHADGHNPLCGDKLTLYVQVADGVINKVTFQGEGCAISMASASLLSEVLCGKTLAEADNLFNGFHDLVTSDSEEVAELGKLKVFAGVKEFPMRVKCATLAWHTLQAALKGEQTTSTE